MATAITMPQLGESVTEGVVARWLKAEGERVERDEPLLEIVTDKVNAEFPSPLAGTLVKIMAEEGATVPVGGELAQIESVAAVSGASDGAAPGRPPAAPTPVTGPEPAATAPTARPEPAATTVGASAGVAHADGGAEGAGERRRYSPVVKRLAEEHRVDLTQVPGSGLAGRVTKDDVLAYIARQTAPPAAASAPAAPQAPAPAVAAPPPPIHALPTRGAPADASTVLPRPGPTADEEYLPLTPMRRTIAEHMVRSKHTAPHATTAIEVDMTPLARWREAHKEAARARHGVDITYVPIVIEAVVEALRAFPILNSAWGDDKIIIKKRINIGVAVGLEEGLVVPVIHDADEKSIVGLARAVSDLAERARAGRLTLQDVQGGTFTVNNVGVFGAVFTTPVINHPEAAILAMNAVVKRPVVVDDAIAIRSMMTLTLSFDHRIVDGLTAGRFMQRVARNIEASDVSSL